MQAVCLGDGLSLQWVNRQKVGFNYHLPLAPPPEDDPPPEDELPPEDEPLLKLLEDELVL